MPNKATAEREEQRSEKAADSLRGAMLSLATAGIGALLAFTSLAGVALAVVAVIVGLNAILHFA